MVPIGVVTVSDRASRGEYEDKGGPAIEAALRDLADALLHRPDGGARVETDPSVCVAFRPK